MNLFFTNIAYAESLDSFLTKVDNVIINPIIMLLFGLAALYFLWGVFDFIRNSDDEEKRTAGKMHMIYGLVGITIMMGVWTILSMLINTLEIKGIDPQKGTVKLEDYTPSPSQGFIPN